MERIRWADKPITFRNLVDNPAVEKPALVQIGTKSIVVGEKINGEFLAASPCKVANNQFRVMEQEIVLSSKHTGMWRVVSKSTSKNEGHIHRLTTKDIERIYKEDVKHERATPRIYICTKDVEGFEISYRNNDPTVVNGQRGERRKKPIEENVEFIITAIGEVEYTPTEGERTSQDYVPKKSAPGTFLQRFIPGIQEPEQLVRNRLLRTLYCTTKDEARKRHFLLEVNEQPCDIRPIASEGSTELRYLQSTKNLFDYMLTYGNDTFLYVKLLRGDPPIKAVEFDGYMVLRRALKGDRIPICRVEDLQMTLVSPDLPVRVKLPVGDNASRSSSEVRAAEVQCMQLSLALLARHESEIYVTVEAETYTSNYLQTTYQQEKQASISRQPLDTNKKYMEVSDERYEQKKPVKNYSGDYRKSYREQSPKLSKASPSSHPASDRLYQDSGKRVSEDYLKTERQRLEQGGRYNQTQRPIIRQKSMTSSSSSANDYKTRANII